MSDAITPDLNKSFFGTVKAVRESKPKSEGLKREDAIHSIKNSLGWEKGLKPYIEARMESLRMMLEVELDGKESMQELGIRFSICSAIGQELQDLISMVESTAAAVERIKQKDVDDKKKLKK